MEWEITTGVIVVWVLLPDDSPEYYILILAIPYSTTTNASRDATRIIPAPLFPAADAADESEDHAFRPHPRPTEIRDGRRPPLVCRRPVDGLEFHYE